MSFLLLCLVALIWPAAAFAHGVSPAISGFYAGGMLVLIGPEDLLQWVALGALAAIQPPRQAGWAAEAVSGGFLAGFAAGCAGWAGSVPLWAGSAGLLAVGTLLVLRACLPFWVLVGLTAAIGTMLGAHAGGDMAARPDGLAIAAGAGITVYALMAVCVATVVWLQRQAGGVAMIASRAFGSWVVAIALLLGAFAMR